MKKVYTAPEAEVIRLKLKDVILSSPTDVVSEQSRDDTSIPDDVSTIEDF